MPVRLVVASAGLGLALAGCGTAAAPLNPATAYSGSITVFAAASLTAAYTAIGMDFQKLHPDTIVRFTFAGSSTLAAQIQQGAIGDVFASADQPNMQKLVDGGLVMSAPSIFARNRLQIVVAAGNPKHITGLADLSRADLVVLLCAPAVPCGRYAAQSLQKAGVTVKPASQEADVKAVLSKVALGEADAGVVYVTDVKAAGLAVQGVDIPDSLNVIADYPIAVLKDTQNLALARAFVRYMLEDAPQAPSDGQRTLRRYGFLSP